MSFYKDGKNYDWGVAEFQFFGVDPIGIQSFKPPKQSKSKKAVYGKGQYPRGSTSGTFEASEGSFVAFKESWQIFAMAAEPLGGPLNLPAVPLVNSFGESDGSVTAIDTYPLCEITSFEDNEKKSGDDEATVTVTYISYKPVIQIYIP